MCYDFLMVSFTQHNNKSLQPKLHRLQNLQAEIFRQLQLLLPDEMVHYDSFHSRVSGSPLLKMDILERHPYTHFVRLTYEFEQNEQTEIAPDAHIRIYNDARLAEVTAFNHDQGFTRTANPFYPQQHLFKRIWQQNQALDKWLSYLLHQGHSLTTMQPINDRISGKQVNPIKEPVGLN
jgi:uncharacterized protein YqiB (DUF1249 family)